MTVALFVIHKLHGMHIPVVFPPPCTRLGSAVQHKILLAEMLLSDSDDRCHLRLKKRLIR